MAMTRWSFMACSVAQRCGRSLRTLSKAIESAEPVFGEVLNRGDAMQRRDIITLLGARRSSLFAARASLG